LPDEVVAQVHAKGVGAEEGLRDQHGVSEAEGSVLLDVRDRDAEAPPVTHGVADLLARVTHHDADIGDTGGGERLDPIEEDGLVGPRNELLGGGERDGSQPGPTAAREDQAFHFSASISGLTSLRYRRPASPCTRPGMVLM